MSLRREWLKNNNKTIDGSILYTKSTHFIMPMIGYTTTSFVGTDGINHLINCHLDLKNNKIKVIIDNTDDPKILKLLQYNTNENHYYHGFDSDDEEREIVLNFHIPDHYRADLAVFLTSKYSKMSTEYKDKLTRLYGTGRNTEDHRPSPYDVLYPTMEKRKQLAKYLHVDIENIDEVSSSLNMDYESYKTIQELTNIKQEADYESK